MTRTTLNSQAAFAKARKLMPGGVSSPVRAFLAVGGEPIFIKEGEGCTLEDIDGNRYTDYVGSYGPLIAGHANERVVAALSKAVGRGTSFGAPTEQETQLASLINQAMASVEMVRFVSSGTEATMSALRLARAATGRDFIIKCAGCYHGHADALLVQAGSGALTFGTPSSPGIPAAVSAQTLVLPYNDLEAAAAMFAKLPRQIAAFIIEPVAGNMGVIPPAAGYLAGLRKLCDEGGTLLIFDEVMTGFRVAWGGAQARYDVKPDLTCLGKIVGGGMPVGAYGGSAKLMEQVSPSGKVYQAGTLSGNPVAMSAGLTTLEIVREKGVYETLESLGQQMESGLVAAAAKAGVPVTVNRVASMLTVFFTAMAGQPVRNFADASACNTQAFAEFFNAMLERGIYLPPSQYEAWFISLAHTPEVIDQTLAAAGEAFAVVAGKKG